MTAIPLRAPSYAHRTKANAARYVETHTQLAREVSQLTDLEFAQHLDIVLSATDFSEDV